MANAANYTPTPGVKPIMIMGETPKNPRLEKLLGSTSINEPLAPPVLKVESPTPQTLLDSEDDDNSTFNIIKRRFEITKTLDELERAGTAFKSVSDEVKQGAHPELIESDIKQLRAMYSQRKKELGG